MSSRERGADELQRRDGDGDGADRQRHGPATAERSDEDGYRHDERARLAAPDGGCRGV